MFKLFGFSKSSTPYQPSQSKEPKTEKDLEKKLKEIQACQSKIDKLNKENAQIAGTKAELKKDAAEMDDAAVKLAAMKERLNAAMQAKQQK